MLYSKALGSRLSVMFCRKRRTPPETDELQSRKTSRVEQNHQGHASGEQGKQSLDKCETEVFVVKRIRCEHEPFWDIPGYMRDNNEFVLRCRRCGADL